MQVSNQHDARRAEVNRSSCLKPISDLSLFKLEEIIGHARLDRTPTPTFEADSESLIRSLPFWVLLRRLGVFCKGFG